MLKTKLICLLSIMLCSILSGCATITGNSMQQVCVDTRDQNYKPIKGVQCKLSNDKGTWYVNSPDTVMVQKSAKPLQIIAQKDGYDPAITSLHSKANAGMFGNIILGGVVGAVVDHSKGTAYNYPNNVSIAMSRAESVSQKKEEKKK